MALGACAANPAASEDFELTVEVQSSVALDQWKVYYDKTGSDLPTSPPPTAADLAANRASEDWLNVLAIDVKAFSPPVQTHVYANTDGPRFVAIIGIQDQDGILAMVNGGTIPYVGYTDGPDSQSPLEAIAGESLDLAPL